MLTVRPESLLHHLELDKISALLLDICLIDDTRREYFPLRLINEKKQLDLILDQVLEFKSAYEHNEMIPIRACASITESLDLLSIEEYALEQEALVHILLALNNLQELARFFEDQERGQRYPLSYQDFKGLSYQNDLYVAFRIVFDERFSCP
jgi:dsDNA-specific endonuclease/ATPase MutS2